MSSDTARTVSRVIDKVNASCGRSQGSQGLSRTRGDKSPVGPDVIRQPQEPANPSKPAMTPPINRLPPSTIGNTPWKTQSADTGSWVRI